MVTRRFRQLARLVLVIGLLASAAGPSPASAAVPVGPSSPTTFARGNCPDPPQPTAPTLPHGALAMYCVPPKWNHQLVVWDHGYVDVTQPVGFYHLNYPDGQGGTVYVPDIVESLGYAFATTSYRENGLAMVDGVQDTQELIAGFSTATGLAKPTRTLVAGASEGGLVATLLAERSPDLVSGALSACGPIGSFEGQMKYIGDMRVLFDYFYPGVLPGSPISPPPSLVSGWSSIYQPAVQSAINADPTGAQQMYRVLHAPVNPDPTQLASTALHVLWYDVFGTIDAATKLGGNPYGNAHRIYLGSDNDLRLNHEVERVTADPATAANIAAYETSGRMTVPLVTMHTTGDDVVPFWHELLYAVKLGATGSSSNVSQIPVQAYGHCQFTLNEFLGAFALLVLKVSGQPPAGLQPSDPKPLPTV